MKKLKYLVIGISVMFIGFISGAYANTAIAGQNGSIKIWFENENGMMQTYCIVDEKTGVNYIVVSGKIYSTGLGTSITPRLNDDGSLYITK